MKRTGFSLIELSIVLVILSLLTGGILAGKSLIRASELRSAISESHRYATAAQAFRDKYFGVPGDITNATMIWGKDNTACPAHSGAAQPSGTCNGSGDGKIYGSAAGATAEAYQFWKQLTLAGMIEGTYSGLSGPGSYLNSIVGDNIPASKLSGAGWTAVTYDNSAQTSDLYISAMNYGNTFLLGKNNGNVINSGGGLKPEEAWNIDSKIDDGLPGTGKLIIYYWSSCSTATSATDFTGIYKFTVTSTNCSLWFRNQF